MLSSKADELACNRKRIIGWYKSIGGDAVKDEMNEEKEEATAIEEEQGEELNEKTLVNQEDKERLSK